MVEPEDIRIAQALIRAGAAARRATEGESEQVEDEQALAEAICARLEALIEPEA